MRKQQIAFGVRPVEGGQWAPFLIRDGEVVTGPHFATREEAIEEQIRGMIAYLAAAALDGGEFEFLEPAAVSGVIRAAIGGIVDCQCPNCAAPGGRPDPEFLN